MEEAAMMPVHGQEFCLRWNNYHTSLSSTLDCFKNDKDFVDVTLACEGKYLMAHKMLLSACSVYFRDLIKVNPCQHPIIILPQEVQFADMEKLLRFIYQGEVNVLQENLSRFLKTAEMFKIRGLAEDNEKQKVLRTCSPGQGSPCPSNGSGGGTAAGECSGTSPKRPRLSLDATSASSSSVNATSTSIINTTTTPSTTTNSLTVTSSSSNTNCASATLVLDTPATPNNEDSTHSANDSDSEMLPVKQEMVELKACDDFETDSEPFNPDKYLKEGVVMTTPASASNDGSNNSSTNKQPPPPPPGPLLPSYVPPPPIKAQEDSPVGGNASDELSQGGMSMRLMSGGVMVGVPYPPPPHLRSHHHPCDTPPSRYTGKRKSPALGGSGSSLRRSPPPYTVSVASSVYQPQIPVSRRSSPNFNTPNQQILPPVSRRSSPNTFNGQPPNMSSSSSSSSSSVLKRSPSFTNKSPRYRKSPVLSASSTFKGTPSNNIKMSPPHSQSPKSCGPSPNSPPPKLNHSYSSPDLSFSAKGSPDENMLPRNNCASAGLGGMSSGGHNNGVGSLMCDICHKTFTSRSNLNKHKRVQHSGEEYRCHLCNRTFKNRYYIKEHLTICASANQKKAAAAAAGGSEAGGGGACSASSAMTSSPALSTAAISYSTMTAGTPPAHLSAAHPAPALAAPVLHVVTAAPAPHDFFKYEPPDDEQPTDLAIHSRSSRQSNSPA